MKKIALIICFGLLAVCECRDDSGGGGGVSFYYEKGFKGEGLEVLVRVDRLTVSAVDTLVVEFEAAGAADTLVTFPDMTIGLDDFEVVDTQVVDDRLGGGGEVIKGQRVRLEPMGTGAVSLPAFRFEYVLKGQVEAKELLTEAVEIEVADRAISRLGSAELLTGPDAKAANSLENRDVVRSVEFQDV